MVVYDDTSNEPVRVFDSGVIVPDPGSFGEYRLTYRTGDIVSPHVAAAEPLAPRDGRLLPRRFAPAASPARPPSSASTSSG